MGTTKQTRDSAQAASEKHPTTGSLPVAETYLSIRLWNSNGPGPPTPLPLESDSPVVSLAADLIAASKGAPVSNRDGLLVTSFHAVLPAVSTARRLQWAIQGLAEGRDLRGTSIAVLIHYAHDLPVNTGDTAVRDALNHATPGQILLTESIGKSFDDLPGFPSKPLDKSGLRELLWRAPEAQSTRSFDEQVLTQLLEQQGLQDDLPEEPEPIAIQVADRSDESDAGERAQSPGFLAMVKSPLGIGIASAAVLLLAALFIFHGRSKPAATDAAPAAPNNPLSGTNSSTGSPPGQAPTDTTKTSTSPATTVSATPPITTAERHKEERLAKEKEKEMKAKTEQAKVVVPTPGPLKPTEDKDKDLKVAHGCDEDAAYYASLFARAKTNYSQGHYGDALRQFETVARCQPGNAQAKDGLEKARNEMRKEN
jgi:hypothetical protein